MSSAVNLQLQLDSRPAPGYLMQALQAIRVTRSDQAPSTFELTFHTERVAGNDDFPLMRDSLLAPFVRVTITVTVAGRPKVLIDGYLTRRRLTPAHDPDGIRLTVSGEDVSLKMNMFQLSLPYPRSADFAMVLVLLAPYLAFKIKPDVKPTPASFVPHDFAPVQNGTHREFLLQLAAKHGYRFYIEPGKPGAGWNTAYWGPPRDDDRPQKSLVADGGPGANVEHIEFDDNALAPTLTYGAVSQYLLPSPAPQTVPVLAAASTRDPLAEEPGMGSYKKLALELLTDPLNPLKKLAELEVRGTLFQPQSQGDLQNQAPLPLEAYAVAQGQTNESTDAVAGARGRLATQRYGEVLDAPGVVPVRGAGYSFDGLYYLRQVDHSIDTTPDGWSYVQDFTLQRGGLGTTVREVSS